MARAKRTFSERPPLPCGSSWWQTIVVTGELPSGYGADLRRELAPILAELPKSVGYKGDSELKARTRLADTLKQLRWTLAARAQWMTKPQQNLCLQTLNEAANHLQKISDIYAKWLARKGGAFALPLPDFPESFDPACTSPGKTFKRGIDTYQCPTKTELEVTRPKDRKRIGTALVDAVAKIRCAQYLIWRFSLYGEALQKSQMPGMGTPPTQPKPRPPIGPGDMGSYRPGDPPLPPPKPDPINPPELGPITFPGQPDPPPDDVPGEGGVFPPEEELPPDQLPPPEGADPDAPSTPTAAPKQRNDQLAVAAVLGGLGLIGLYLTRQR